MQVEWLVVLRQPKSRDPIDDNLVKSVAPDKLNAADVACLVVMDLNPPPIVLFLGFFSSILQGFLPLFTMRSVIWIRDHFIAKWTLDQHWPCTSDLMHS